MGTRTHSNQRHSFIPYDVPGEFMASVSKHLHSDKTLSSEIDQRSSTKVPAVLAIRRHRIALIASILIILVGFFEQSHQACSAQ